MSGGAKINPSDSDNICVVCFKNVNIYSVGICDHPVCFECSTRMRVLCRQNECPICRQDMQKVIFCEKVDTFKKLKAHLMKYSNHMIEDRKFGICFENTYLQRAYFELLDHNCNKCERLGPFRNFNLLKEHVRREHELYYCDLCVNNLRIFTWERKCYTRQELAQHRRKGDVDDTSHRGHPLCEFCDMRYMDSDELFRHLRRDHFYCHFCDADGLHQYYPTYESLRQHFQKEHYLCEEGDCVHEQFTSVFRSDIDLKAHRASVHVKHLSKAATKQARTLELEFTLAPRPRPEPQQSRGRKTQSYYSQNDRLQDEGAVGYDVNYIEPQEIQSVQLTPQDFPSLSGATPTIPLRSPGTVTIKHVTRGQKGLARNDENFPALSSDSGTVRLSVNSSVGSNQDRAHTSQNTSNVSIQVNHRPNGAITTHISSQNNSGSVKIRPHSSKDFPALSSAPVPEVQWVKPSAPKEPKPKVHKVAPCPILPHRDSPVDFPSLGKGEGKTKKSSSVTVPVATSWLNSTNSEQGPKETWTKMKTKKKKSKSTVNNNLGNESIENKSKSMEEVKKEDINRNETEPKKLSQPNGVIKKRSELKIESLQINDSMINGNENFPTLGASKLPPGFSLQPPPGFAANDLTFTNSSGQSYSILPIHHFIPPPNFGQRNRTLIEFMSGLKSNEEILEFKKLSNMFRNGDLNSRAYYEHCKQVIGDDFPKIFSELLVLLPDIEKQQELYNHHLKEGGSKRSLDVCATCNQVVSFNDLRSHLGNHTLENHFPALGAQEISSVWRK